MNELSIILLTLGIFIIIVLIAILFISNYYKKRNISDIDILTYDTTYTLKLNFRTRNISALMIHNSVKNDKIATDGTVFSHIDPAIFKKNIKDFKNSSLGKLVKMFSDKKVSKEKVLKYVDEQLGIRDKNFYKDKSILFSIIGSYNPEDDSIYVSLQLVDLSFPINDLVISDKITPNKIDSIIRKFNKIIRTDVMIKPLLTTLDLFSHSEYSEQLMFTELELNKLMVSYLGR
jgi:hypothetical protein